MSAAIPAPSAPPRRSYGRKRLNTDCSLRLGRFVRERMALAEDCMVTVTELRGTRPGGPRHETLISVFRPRRPPLRLLILKPLADVMETDVALLLCPAPGAPDAPAAPAPFDASLSHADRT